MKTWKKQIKITDKNRHSDNKGRAFCKLPNGLYDVLEADDNECKGNIAPRSHGFVNLFKHEEFVGWCGVAWAKKRLVHAGIFKDNTKNIQP